MTLPIYLKSDFYINVYYKQIQVKFTNLGRSHQITGRIWVNKENINLKMVENGFAWHFKKYSSSPVFAKAEKREKSMKKGLWGQNNATAPCKFRHQNH